LEDWLAVSSRLLPIPLKNAYSRKTKMSNEKEFTVANEDVKLSQTLPEEIKKDIAAEKKDDRSKQ